MYYMGLEQDRELSVLQGLTLDSVERNSGDDLIFKSNDGRIFILGHQQDCCESVTIDDIVGDLSDLIGTPILLSEESSSDPIPPKKDEYDDSFTWTFYRFRTIKGSVTVKFYGTSNGYYSEGVSFAEMP